jgi:molybdenum cofactor cytidylyltransferase
MVGWKPMLEYQGRPLILNSLANALSACTRVVIVTGFRAEELEQLLASEYPHAPQLQVVRNADYERGMFSSIQTGAARVGSSWFFVALGDMPEIPPRLYFQLADRIEAAPRTSAPYDIIRPLYRGKPAHPVLMNRRVIETLCKMPADAHMQKMFEQHSAKTGGRVLEIEVDEPGSLYDIDTAEDLQKITEEE